MFQNYCVNNAVFLDDNKIVYTTVYKKDLEKFSAGDDYTDGIAETLRAIDTTEVSFVAKEVDSNLQRFQCEAKVLMLQKCVQNLAEADIHLQPDALSKPALRMRLQKY